MLEWLIAQWPLAVGGAAAAMGIAAWVEKLKAVRELQLKIKLLERELSETDRHLVEPTSEEIARYGLPRPLQQRKRVDIPTALLLIAIVAPVIAYAYQQHRSRVQVSQLRVQLKQIDDRLTSIEGELEATTSELQELQRHAIAELHGTSGTGFRGSGPAYRSLMERESVLRRRQNELESARTTLQGQRRQLESRVAK
jgi:chromosome segregation ATPase